MKRNEAYDLLCKEYLSNLEAGCNGCIAQIYCIKNNLRKEDRWPHEDCANNLKKYFQHKQLK